MKNSLDPNQYSEARTILKSVGPAIIAIGGLLTVVGLVSFFSTFGGGGFPTYFWCAIVGLPIMGFGVMITKFAYLGTITRYMAGEVAPVGKDVTNYMIAGTKDSIRDAATAVGEGFAASGAFGASKLIPCPNCNAMNDDDANFCSGCGAPIATSKPCAKCGELIDFDARFCDSCGAAVAK